MARGTKGRVKTLVSYKIDEDLLNMFRSTTAFEGITMSDVVENAIKEYVVAHKQIVDEKMSRFFDTGRPMRVK